MGRYSIGVALFFALGVFPVAAAPMNIIVDEFGNMSIDGVLSSGYFADDPGPGGLPGVLTYNLPFIGNQGDVFITDFGCGCLSDVVRFNGDGTLIFYSSDIGGFTAPGDTFAPPQDFYDNFVIIGESGDPIFNNAMFTPGEGDPGFDASMPNYTFVSDDPATPEPNSIFLMASGLGVLGLLRPALTRVGRR